MLILPVDLVADRVHSGAMSEGTTQDMSNGRSFEARVFAHFDWMDTRFDLMNTRFDSLDVRVGALETHSERRALETKPIWERALAEIGEVKSDLSEVKSELGEVKSDLGEVKSDLGEVKSDLGEVKSELRQVKSELEEVKSELGEVKTGLTEVKERVGALGDVTKLIARKLDVLNRDLTTLRAEQLGLEDRVEKLEPHNLP